MTAGNRGRFPVNPAAPPRTLRGAPCCNPRGPAKSPEPPLAGSVLLAAVGPAGAPLPPVGLPRACRSSGMLVHTAVVAAAPCWSPPQFEIPALLRRGRGSACRVRAGCLVPPRRPASRASRSCGGAPAPASPLLAARLAVSGSARGWLCPRPCGAGGVVGRPLSVLWAVWLPSPPGFRSPPPPASSVLVGWLRCSSGASRSG